VKEEKMYDIDVNKEVRKCFGIRRGMKL